MPSENLPARLSGHGGEADEVEHLVDPRLGDVVGLGQRTEVVVGAAAGWKALASSSAPTSRSGHARSS